MNKENIGFRLAAIMSFMRVVSVKARHKMIVISKIISRYLNRAVYGTGRALSKAGRAVRDFMVFTKNRIVENRKKVAFGTLGFCTFIICGLCVVSAMTSYEYSYKGQTLGVVNNAECVYEGVREAEQTLTEAVGAQVIIDADEDIEVKRVIGSISEVGAEEDVVNALTAIDEIKVVTWAINITSTVDEKTGETTTQSIYVDTNEHAEEVLAAVKEEFTKDIDPAELVEVTFEQDVTVEESRVMLEEIVDTASAIKTIMTGGIEEKIHVVKKGDSVADIAEKYDVSRKKLKKWNPHIGDDNILYLNQEIQLQEQIPLIDVLTTRNVTFTEDYGPEIEYNDTDNLYIGQEIVTKKGKSGNRTVNADIIEKNGEQVERNDLSYTVHKEQKTRKVMRGTKERPEKIGEGYYYYPMSGNFSSPFGMRWGRLHQGIDISGPTGTNIYAADAGVVVESAYMSNGYGNAIKVDHGNGRSTYYAHNSENLVKVGDIVYRGQHIAESGNTGNSTGPHLHFETRFDDVAKDPTKYL